MIDLDTDTEYHFEIWGCETEMCMFPIDDGISDTTYDLFTNDADNNPMNFIASLKANYKDAKIIYEDLMDSGQD